MTTSWRSNYSKWHGAAELGYATAPPPCCHRCCGGSGDAKKLGYLDGVPGVTELVDAFGKLLERPGGVESSKG